MRGACRQQMWVGPDQIPTATASGNGLLLTTWHFERALMLNASTCHNLILLFDIYGRDWHVKAVTLICFCWIRALLAYSRHCRAMGCRLEGVTVILGEMVVVRAGGQNQALAGR